MFSELAVALYQIVSQGQMHSIPPAMLWKLVAVLVGGLTLVAGLIIQTRYEWKVLRKSIHGNRRQQFQLIGETKFRYSWLAICFMGLVLITISIFRTESRHILWMGIIGLGMGVVSGYNRRFHIRRELDFELKADDVERRTRRKSLNAFVEKVEKQSPGIFDKSSADTRPTPLSSAERKSTLKTFGLVNLIMVIATAIAYALYRLGYIEYESLIKIAVMCFLSVFISIGYLIVSRP